MSNPVGRQVLLQLPPHLDRSGDLSAVVWAPEGYLWLASDESTSIECLQPSDGSAFGQHQSFDLASLLPGFDPGLGEVDIEGLDLQDHYLWLVGSHSRTRPKAKGKTAGELKHKQITIDANRYLLARIPCVEGCLCSVVNHPTQTDQMLTAACLERSPTSSALLEALKDDPYLGAVIASGLAGKENGFDIEGLAVHQHRIWLGLRGPVLRGVAILLEIEVKETDPGRLKLKKSPADRRYQRHFVDLDGLGVRDLCFDGKDLLILAGPTMDLDGTIGLYRLHAPLDLPDQSFSSQTSGQVERLQEIPHGFRCDRAEGLTLFSDGGPQRSVLIVYDSPASRRQTGSGVWADVVSWPSTEPDLLEEEREFLMNLSPAYLKWEAATLEKGRLEGKLEGKLEGSQEEALLYTLRLLNRRFGSVAPLLHSQIQQLSKSELENLGEAVLDFSTEADLMAWLAHNL
jgi:hypothetical protein